MDQQRSVSRGEIIAVCISARRGIPKVPQAQVEVLEDYGIRGDRHAGSRTRQISLLEQEVLDDLTAEGVGVTPGLLGENITVRGIPFQAVRPGDRLGAGVEVVLEVIEPRVPCRTLSPVDARLPQTLVGRAGLLCRVVHGGKLQPGDEVRILEPRPRAS